MTDRDFHVGVHHINFVNAYKYLGVVFNEHLNFSECKKSLAEAAERAFGGMIYKLKQIKYTGYKTYKKLYETCIVPIMNYKFAKIMNSNSKHLYRYVEEAWKLRKKEVFENNVS